MQGCSKSRLVKNRKCLKLRVYKPQLKKSNRQVTVEVLPCKTTVSGSYYTHVLTNISAELPGLHKTDHKTVLEEEQSSQFLLLQQMLMRTLSDFNVVGFDYQAIPKTRVGNLSVRLKYTIYSFHPHLAPSPQTCIKIRLVIMSQAEQQFMLSPPSSSKGLLKSYYTLP